ncbi:MAG: aconitate hydratase AcnA, partial [Bdellovibrionales bacterium]|nr:aconitate hydratase AcnA [Bdellovibrionales bacterium]
GATCGLFPIDERTVEYLRLTNRTEAAELTEAYYKEQGLWYSTAHAPEYSDVLELDLSTVEPSLAGPSRPQDRVAVKDVAAAFKKDLPKILNQPDAQADVTPKSAVKGETFKLGHGSVVLAAITSCTNTSNPGVLMAAGILAKKAVEKGLTVKPWVKTSLAPGSKVVTDYLVAAGLMAPLRDLKFQVVGYGCTTCIGNSGPLPTAIEETVLGEKLAVASVLSGNRNFEGRVHANIRANYLASPPLVVAYALAGTVNLDLMKDSLGTGKDGKPVYLKDIWPTPDEVDAAVAKHVTGSLFQKSYADVFKGPEAWQKLPAPKGDLYQWDTKSTYIKEPPYFEGMGKTPPGISDIHAARCLCNFGDSITTDHISPAGSIAKDSPAAKYLGSHGVEKKDFNSYGARRGNHEVMVRGTFANTRIKNKMVPGVEGGVTKHQPSGEQSSIFDAAMKYRGEKVPTVVLAGKEYGTGSSRDWAAKGPYLQGVRAVISESFERIHRSNLVGMGIVPLCFKEGESAATLGLDGTEVFDFPPLKDLKPGQMLKVTAKKGDGKSVSFDCKVRINTPNELEYVKHGGILQFVLRQILNS